MKIGVLLRDFADFYGNFQLFAKSIIGCISALGNRQQQLHFDNVNLERRVANLEKALTMMSDKPSPSVARNSNSNLQ